MDRAMSSGDLGTVVRAVMSEGCLALGESRDAWASGGRPDDARTVALLEAILWNLRPIAAGLTVCTRRLDSSDPARSDDYWFCHYRPLEALRLLKSIAAASESPERAQPGNVPAW